jgi:hypothetical protein
MDGLGFELGSGFEFSTVGLREPNSRTT